MQNWPKSSRTVGMAVAVAALVWLAGCAPDAPAPVLPLTPSAIDSTPPTGADSAIAVSPIPAPTSATSAPPATPASSTELQPVTPGAVGRRAFELAAAIYAGKASYRDIEPTLTVLHSADPDKAAASRAFLLALLQQMTADDTNGRHSPTADWQTLYDDQQTVWGWFRQCVTRTFAEHAGSADDLPIALWLAGHDSLAVCRKAGLAVLRKIPEPGVAEHLHELLDDPCAPVVVGALEEIAIRKPSDAATVAAVRRMCIHYRGDIRAAAQAAGLALGLKGMPDPAAAAAQATATIPPNLGRRLAAIAAMVYPPIPPDAKLCQITLPFPENPSQPPFQFVSWVVWENGQPHIVADTGNGTGYGRFFTAQPTTLSDLAGLDKAFRALPPSAALPANVHVAAAIDPTGLAACLAQEQITPIEVLLAAWCYTRGDSADAATFLFPRLETLEEEAWLTFLARSELARNQYRTLVALFQAGHDEEALGFAKHLAQPEFQTFEEAQNARQLAAELPQFIANRGKIELPTADEWAVLRRSLDRAAQIRYWADRTWLAQSRWGIWTGDWFGSLRNGHPLGSMRLNPFDELMRMDLTPAELGSLADGLTNPRLMRGVGHRMGLEFYGKIQQARWGLVHVINTAAGQDLIEPDRCEQFTEADWFIRAAGVAVWSQTHAAETREQVLLDCVRTNPHWDAVLRAADRLAERRCIAALPVFAEREKDRAENTDPLAEFAWQMTSPLAVDYAREMRLFPDSKVRCYAGLILLKYGDRAHEEGLADLADNLGDVKRDWHLIAVAVEQLIDYGTPRALTLAQAQLDRINTEDSDDLALSFAARMMRLKRPEAYAWIQAHLADTTPFGQAWQQVGDRSVAVPLTRADYAAQAICRWRADGGRFEITADEMVRWQQRAAVTYWLREQWRKIQAGQPSAMQDDPSIAQATAPKHFEP